MYEMRSLSHCITFLATAICLIFILTIVDDSALLHVWIPRGNNKTKGKSRVGLSLPNLTNNSRWIPNNINHGKSKFTTEHTNTSIHIISIILDFQVNVTESNMNDWLSHLGFAKMIQLEAEQRHGMETQIIWIGSIHWNNSCPINILKDVIFTTDRSEFDVLQLKQEKWLGEKYKLLNAGSRDWIGALDLLKKLKKSKRARYDNRISLPFIKVNDIPAVDEWTHILDLKRYFAVDPSCCSLKYPESNYVVIDLNASLLPSLNSLSDSITAINGTDIILLDSSMKDLSKSFAAWAHQKGYVMHFRGVENSNYSDFSKYCLLQRDALAFVGSLHSPLSLWAGLTKSSSSVVELISNDVSEIKRLRQIAFSSGDPRANILYETFYTSGASYQKLGNAQYPISLVVETSEHPEENIGYGYAYQYLLQTSFKIFTNLVVLRSDKDREQTQQRFQECFVHPNLSSIVVSTKSYRAKLYDLKVLGLHSVFRVKGWFTQSSNHKAMLEILLNSSSIDIISEKSGKKHSNDQLITFPFIAFHESAKVKADEGFREKFDSIFDRRQGTKACKTFYSHESLWAMIFNKEELNVDKITDQTVADTEETSALYHGQIVVQLSGEMANQLCKIAYGLGLKWILEEDYNTSTKIIWRHQDSEKWKRARDSVIMCFPKLRKIDFSQGNTQEFITRKNQQASMFGKDTFYFYKCEDEYCIRKKLEAFLKNLNQSNQKRFNIPVNANITLPFLYADTLAMFGYINDRYYDRFRILFEIDLENLNCCSLKAVLKESIVHARGFMQEMPAVAKKLGFEELSPNKTVKEVLKDYRPGDKVAVVSRFSEFGEKYVHEMVEAKLDARLIENLNGMQSFCFLLSGVTEFIGYSKSTFAIWAAYLGHAKRNRLYNLRSPERGNGIIWYNFSNMEIRKRFSFEDYNSEEQDKLEEQKLLA
jgi:hypothetical protein